MSSSKTLLRRGVQAGAESSYGTGGTADVGLLPMEEPEVELTPLFDGERGQSPEGGMLVGVGRSGLGAAFDLVTHCYTPGIAYAADESPSVDLALRASGFGVATSFTPSSESYTYTPEASGFDSLIMEVYSGGEKWDITGAYADFSIAVEGPGIPVWTFAFQGIGSSPSDAATPTIAYPHVDDQKPLKATNVTLAIGAFTGGILRGFEYSHGRGLAARANDASGGHAGFTPEPRNPSLTLTIERAARGSIAAGVIDPDALADAGTELAISMVFGSVQYKQWTATWAKGVIKDVRAANDGPTATWELDIAPGLLLGTQTDVVFLFD